MAKDKDKKKAGAKSANKPRAAAKPKPKSGTRRATVTKAVQGARKKAAQLASNPAIAEIVAASLVAAAAAIKNPKKARAMAMAVGDELETASKQAVDRGSAFWTLALDIARRSIDALGSQAGADSGTGKAKKSSRTKAAKPRAAGKAKTGSKKKTRK